MTLPEVLEEVKRLNLAVTKLIEKSNDELEKALAAASANIIDALSNKIENCTNNTEILDALSKNLNLEKGKEKEIPKLSKWNKYSYPAFNVGNPEYGDSAAKNPPSFPSDPKVYEELRKIREN